MKRFFVSVFSAQLQAFITTLLSSYEDVLILNSQWDFTSLWEKEWFLI